MWVDEKNDLEVLEGEDSSIIIFDQAVWRLSRPSTSTSFNLVLEYSSLCDHG